ncbi:MAG: hypothetical protein M3T56_04590 [Chloroflexota bacterium]|nr:hypothetical protein [Chloroflexota bacterium]
MTFAKGLITGFGVVLILEIVCFLVAGLVLATQGAPSLRWEIGGLPIFAYEKSGQSVGTTIGPGIAVVAAVAGLLNGIGALVLTRNEPHAP